MVHNGIEYGIMAAYAEGLGVLRAANAGTQTRTVDAETTPLRDPEHYQYQIALPQVAEVWRRGSVIASWLLDLTATALVSDPELKRFAGPRVGLRRRPLDDQGRGGYRRADAGADRIALRALQLARQRGFSGQAAVGHAAGVWRSSGEARAAGRALPMADNQCDALVFFGATGDLAYKKIFPSLQAMIKRGTLNVPVIGVAKSGWSLEQLQERARDSLEHHGGIDTAAFARLKELLRYIDGGYEDLETFKQLKKALGEASRPAHYLAIPPALFGDRGRSTWRRRAARPRARASLSRSRSAAISPRRARSTASCSRTSPRSGFSASTTISARARYTTCSFSGSAIRCTRRSGTGEYIESIQITMAEDFGIQGRGAFYDSAGTIRDVVQNHLFQVLSNLAMEPPARTDSESDTRRKGEGAQVDACARPG